MTQKNANTLRVSCRSGSFRRAGYRFGTDPQDLPLAALSEEERIALVNEPMLDVVEVAGSAEVDVPRVAVAEIHDTALAPATTSDPAPVKAPAKKTAAKAKG